MYVDAEAFGLAPRVAGDDADVGVVERCAADHGAVHVDSIETSTTIFVEGVDVGVTKRK